MNLLCSADVNRNITYNFGLFTSSKDISDSTESCGSCCKAFGWIIIYICLTKCLVDVHLGITCNSSSATFTTTIYITDSSKRFQVYRWITSICGCITTTINILYDKWFTTSFLYVQRYVTTNCTTCIIATKYIFKTTAGYCQRNTTSDISRLCTTIQIGNLMCV